jgi:transposase
LTTIENHEGNIEHLNGKMTNGRNRGDARQWRRSLVLDLDSQGYTHREIVSKLQISKGTVSNDLAFLRKQAQDNLQYHIHEAIPDIIRNAYGV